MLWFESVMSFMVWALIRSRHKNKESCVNTMVHFMELQAIFNCIVSQYVIIIIG